MHLVDALLDQVDEPRPPADRDRQPLPRRRHHHVLRGGGPARAERHVLLGQVQHLPGQEPGRRRRVVRQVLHQPVDERHVDRLLGEVVPERVDGRGPQQHPAGAGAPLDQGRLAVVEAGRHRRLGPRLHRPEAEEAGRRHVPAAGRGEHLEHRVAVVDEAERAAPAGAVRRRSEHAGQQVRIVPRPRGSFPGHDEQAAARLDERGQRLARFPRRPRDVVEHHHLPVREVRRREAPRRRRAHVERRLGPDAERARQEQIGFVPGGRVADDQHRDHLPRRDDEVEDVVGRQRVRRDADRPGRPRVAEGHRREVDRRGTGRRQVRGKRFNLAALQLQGHLEVFDRGGAAVRQPRRHLHPLAPGEVLALEEHAGHADVGLGRGVLPDLHRRQHRPAREPDPDRALHARALKVADEHRLEARQVRGLEDALGELQGRPVAGHARADLRVGDQAAEGGAVGRRARTRPGAAVEQDHRPPVAGVQRVDDVGGQRLRVRPAPAGAHAPGTVQQHHHLPRPAGHGGQGRGAHERAGEGEEQQEQRGAAQQQQEPVPDPLAAEGPVGHLPQEHQRGELDLVLPLALDHVQDDRHGDGRESEQEEGGQQSHQRTRFSFSRIARNRNRAWSIGCAVLKKA